MKILFIGARLFDDVYFYLQEKNIKSILTESNENSDNLDLADKYYIVPRGMSEPLKIAIEEKVDGVIPLIGIDTPLFDVALMKEVLENNYNIPVISSNKIAIKICINKFLTKKFFRYFNIKTPKYFIFNNNKDDDNNEDNKTNKKNSKKEDNEDKNKNMKNEDKKEDSSDNADYNLKLSEIDSLDIINSSSAYDNLKSFIKYLNNYENKDYENKNYHECNYYETNVHENSNNLINNPNFPCVLKQFEGQGGKDIVIAKDMNSFVEYTNKFNLTLCEEYIDGYEISIEVLSYKNVYIPLVPVYKGETSLEGIHPLNKVRYAPSEVEGLDNDLVKDLAVKIAKNLNAEGTIDIDFIFSKKNKELYVIEINPRPSGTRYLSMASTSISPLLKLVDMISGDFNLNKINNEIKNYCALEVPIGSYTSPKLEKSSKKFDKNSWVVHGPENYKRVTVSGENKEKLFEIVNDTLNLEI
ncbi:MAG: ATP-grasp domain-containing protein [Methanobrevibacter sp.]|jgi:carbamoylphosphate synthase large subunit|nr:ATP-grasp domain-containing protein [Candidatus Methanovirga australis]